MINAEDASVIDFRTSNTKDEIVAKLLGWMRGPERLRSILVTENGIPEEQLPYLHSLEEPLNVLLEEQREAARQALLKAANAGAASETINEKNAAVEHCQEQINKAFQYFLDIDDELAKEDPSELQIDQRETARTGDVHLMLTSVDRWARKRYGIAILESSQSADAQSNIAGDKKITQENGGSDEETPETLQVTFALLVEAFATIATGFNTNGKPNVIAIARHLSKLATDVNSKERLFSQSNSSIKTRIVKAMRIKQKNSS